MRIRFWGVRGSTPTPGISKWRYGGNTPCVEVMTTGNQRLILDAGSGIRELGRRMAAESPRGGDRIMLFLTHFHWDHIQGLPFFAPLYNKRNFVYMHGFGSPAASLEEVLSGQMANPYFPVSMTVMKATRHFYTLDEEQLKIGDGLITSCFLNHPQGCLAYRIQRGERTVVYATDHEHGSRKHDRNLEKLAEGADILIYDAQYTPREYKSKVGWGHSTWKAGVKIARRAGVKQLILFHHDPEHTDEFMDILLAEARQEFPALHAAAEGMEIELTGLRPEIAHRKGLEKRQRIRNPVPVRMSYSDGRARKTHTIAEDLSVDGAYFVSSQALHPGDQLEVELELRTGEGKRKLVRLPARVVRTEKRGSKTGVGVVFR